MSVNTQNNSNGDAQPVFTHCVPALCRQHMDCLNISVTNEDQFTAAAAPVAQGPAVSVIHHGAVASLKVNDFELLV